METLRYVIKQGQLDRWYIESARDPDLAWSGSHWVDHEAGVGLRTHLSLFPSREEAEQYAKEVFGK